MKKIPICEFTLFTGRGSGSCTLLRVDFVFDSNENQKKKKKHDTNECEREIQRANNAKNESTHTSSTHVYQPNEYDGEELWNIKEKTRPSRVSGCEVNWTIGRTGQRQTRIKRKHLCLCSVLGIVGISENSPKWSKMIFGLCFAHDARVAHTSRAYWGYTILRRHPAVRTRECLTTYLARIPSPSSADARCSVCVCVWVRVSVACIQHSHG